MPESLRTALRRQISTFHQLPNELFWQAWQRFDGYRRMNPLLGYSDVELLQFFYYGVRRYFQVELDGSDFWDFCDEYTQGAFSLCDEMAFRSLNDPMAEIEAQDYYLMEEANNREDIRFNTVKQEQINRSPFQESIYCDFKHPHYDQEQAPPSQYQCPTPQPSKPATTLEDLQAAFLEAEKRMKKMQEEFAAMKGYSESKHTPVRMVGIQMDEVVELTESKPETLPMCIAAEEETERMDSELTVLRAEFAEEINLQPLPEHFEALEKELGAAESKEEMLKFLEEPPPVAIIQTTLVVQEEVTTLDEDTLLSQEVQELEDAPRFELSAETEDFSLTETEDISLTKNQTEHGFYAAKIIESAAMPRKGPDKPAYYTVSHFDRIVQHGIEDRIAHCWSMSKKGNGFPWDNGISGELKLSNDPELDGQRFWVSNLLQLPLLLDQNKSRFLIGDAGKTAGIPRTGPDILSFHEFDQSQFLRFAGEGGCITYCDVIGSVTRPPEILLNVPVLC